MSSIIGWALASGLVVWVVLALRSGNVPAALWLWLKHPKNASKALRGLTWALATIFAGLAWIAWMNDPESLLGSFFTDAVMAAVTIIVIDEIGRRRSGFDYKQSIIQQMASQSHDFALDAVRIASEAGWLKDGSLQGAKLIGASLQGAQLERANLRRAILHSINLQDAHLENADLQHVMVWKAQLQRVHLDNADLQSAYISESVLESAHLDRADLQDVQMYFVNLQGAHMNGANLKGADLEQVNLQGANLWGADFQGARLEEVYLKYASMCEAYLQGANLLGADLEDAKLGRVRYNNKTIWPDGFTPPADAINVDQS